jgi:hypothetical protein
MQAWANAGRTGDAHARLADPAGLWRAEMVMWRDPDAAPVKTTYRVARAIQLGGRVLHDGGSGDFMGQPYRGIGRAGYDNGTGKFWSTWPDNMSTGLMASRGKRQADGSIQMTGEYVDSVGAETIPARFAGLFPDPDSERMEAYETRDGEEFMNMRIWPRMRAARPASAAVPAPIAMDAAASGLGCPNSRRPQARAFCRSGGRRRACARRRR